MRVLAVWLVGFAFVIWGVPALALAPTDLAGALWGYGVGAVCIFASYWVAGL